MSDRLSIGVPVRRAPATWTSAAGPRRPASRVIRYERTRVDELVHLDMKRLGRIGVIGHRIHGAPRRRTRGVEWETVHVCLEDYSRTAYVEVVADQTATMTAGFLRRAAASALCAS